MPKLKLPYYSFLHSKRLPESSNRNFYESNEFHWAKLIEDNFDVIQKEFTVFFQNENHQLQPYFAVEMMNAPKKWQTIGFYFWGLRDKKNCLNCNKSFTIFNQIPGLVSVSFSLMEPNSEIKPHHGDTDAIYRCHLPLLVPGKLPEIGFQVGEEKKSWEEGKLLIFNDASYHTGWNKTESRRIVLMLDIIKEEYAFQKTWICSMVLSSLILQKHFHISFQNKKNLFNKAFLYFTAFIIWYYFSVVNHRALKFKPVSQGKK